MTLSRFTHLRNPLEFYSRSMGEAAGAEVLLFGLFTYEEMIWQP